MEKVYANCIILALPSDSKDHDIFLKRTKNLKTFENGKTKADFYLGDYVGEYIFSGENWLEVKLADGKTAYGAVDIFAR